MQAAAAATTTTTTATITTHIYGKRSALLVPGTLTIVLEFAPQHDLSWPLAGPTPSIARQLLLLRQNLRYRPYP